MYCDKLKQRKQIKSIVSTLNLNTQKEWAEQVFRQIEATDEWQKAKTIGLYCSLSDELPTYDVIERWADSKRIVLPVVNGNEMDFYEYDRSCNGRSGAYGILEPVSSVKVEPESIALIIVPGIAFDTTGHRLGRGKGYYDKYLVRTSAYRIGVCSAVQLLDNLECEAHDQIMDQVVTPSSMCARYKEHTLI